MKLWRQQHIPRATGHFGRSLALLAALVTLAACAGTVAAPSEVPAGRAVAAAPAVSNGTVTAQRMLTVGGMKRSYLAIGPSTHHKGLPLVIVMHGRGITAQQESTRTGFLPYAEKGVADIVYPLGINESWNAGHGCCGVAAKKGVDDSAFLAQLTTDATHYFESDIRRIYLVGYSNGAKLSFQQTCTHPGTYAAIATYGAVPLVTCTGGKPLSAFMAAGTADPYVRTEHSSPSATAGLEAAIAQWRARNGCSAPPSVTRTGVLTRTAWSGCGGGTQLTQGIYAGLTHYWPTGTRTGAPYTTPVGEDAAAATVMWDFLSRQHLA